MTDPILSFGLALMAPVAISAIVARERRVRPPRALFTL
jgi:hypothetical protein